MSDSDSKFTSKLWKGLFKGFETNMNFNTAYHPNFDGKIERLNQVIEDILRMYVMEKPYKWKTTYTWYNLPTTMGIRDH
jgi:hypothetical protein